MRGTRLWLAIALIASLFATAIVTGCGDDEDEPATDEPGTVDTDLGLASEGELLVGSDIPYIPFEFGDPPAYEGFDIDLINEVADRLGLEARIADTPFDAILQGGNGRFDLAIAATTIDAEREKAVDFSDPYFLSQQSLLVPADGDIQSLEDITADTVVGGQDATTGERFANDETDADVRGFPEIDDAYGAVASGQVDAVINDLFSTQAAVEENPDLEVAEVFQTGELYGIVLPEKSDALREAVNGALAEIKEDGTLEELYQEYFGEEAPAEVLDATNEPT